MGQAIDLTGKRFSKLLVIKRVQSPSKKSTFWACLCDCGKEKNCRGDKLRCGSVKSCGCSHHQAKHGMIGTRTYGSWCSMKSRVLNPQEGKKGETYGNLGICDRWVKSFEEFVEDMGVAPTEKHTIERIDNAKGYFPDNCRWATQSEQTRNTSQNRNITINGKTQCVADWAREFGVPPQRIYHRLRRGWSGEESLTR